MIPVFDRYVARRLITAFLIVMTIVVTLIMIGDLVESTRRSGTGSVGILGHVAMAALHAPTVTLKTVQIAMLMAAIWTFIRLSRSSEMVAARAAGYSFWRMAAPACVAAAVLGALMAGAYNPLAAVMLDQRDRLDARWFDGRASLLSISSEGLWLREGLRDQMIVIHALGANGEGTELRDATFFQFTLDDRFAGRVDADIARLGDGRWMLENAVARRLNLDDPNEIPTETRSATASIPTALTAQRIQESFASPETISVWELPAFIAEMERNGFNAHRHRTHFHATLALPLSFAALTLIAAALAIRPPRFARYGLIALTGALTGFLVYALTDVTLALGGAGSIAPPLGAWAPAVATLLLGAALALRFEEGTT